MSIVRFYGDLHFGHKFVSKLRGFETTEKHDDFIIDKYNSIVNKKDTTYILGDISMENVKLYPKLKKLLGRKIIVLGNHDPHRYVKQLLEYVDSVAGVVKYKGYFVTHIPIHPREFSYRQQNIRGNIHAHTHEDISKEDPRYICVSAEVLNYKPITLDEINTILTERKTNDTKRSS